MSFLLELGVSLGVALLGWLGGALTRGGALAATLVGFVTLTSCGWPGALILGSFFVPSTLIGRITAGTAEIRTAAQVFANGGPAMLGSLLEYRTPGLGLWILTTSLAAASADTWATSLGRWSRSDPVLLGTRRRVPTGASGGVSIPGTIGALLGATVVAGAGVSALGHPAWFGIAVAIGIGGMFLDSALGAWVQARFVCPICRAPTEAREHGCGNRTILERGWGWLDNNGVNLLTTMAAAVMGLAIWALR